MILVLLRSCSAVTTMDFRALYLVSFPRYLEAETLNPAPGSPRQLLFHQIFLFGALYTNVITRYIAFYV